MKWEENTKELIKKANTRLCLLRKVASFKPLRNDLRLIYIQYVRSILEQSCVVWHSSLTQEDASNIERVQKNSIRIILKHEYISYEQALEKLNLETLEQRRENLCLKFAKKCLKNSHASDMFELKDDKHLMELRKNKKYKVNHANTERYKQSAVPYMQRLLNKVE